MRRPPVDRLEPHPLLESETARGGILGGYLAIHHPLAIPLKHKDRSTSAARDMVRVACEAFHRQRVGPTDRAGSTGDETIFDFRTWSRRHTLGRIPPSAGETLAQREKAGNGCHQGCRGPVQMGPRLRSTRQAEGVAPRTVISDQRSVNSDRFSPGGGSDFPCPADRRAWPVALSSGRETRRVAPVRRDVRLHPRSVTDVVACF